MQKKDYQKLRECPFCGSKAEIRFILGIEKLIDMWNRRADNGKV